MTGRGRPPVGERIEVRLPTDLLDRVDTVADAGGITRAAALRDLLERGVDAWWIERMGAKR